MDSAPGERNLVSTKSLGKKQQPAPSGELLHWVSWHVHKSHDISREVPAKGSVKVYKKNKSEEIKSLMWDDIWNPYCR